MKIRNGTLMKGSLPALAAAILCTPSTQAQINVGGYTCSADFSRTHNLATAITIRTVACGTGFQSTYAHWYNLGVDVDMAGSYTTLKCVDWSYWASNVVGDQPIFIRVYQDLTPGRDGTCPQAGFGNASDPGPDVAGRLLLWEGETIFPQSPDGVAGGTPPRADGDRSIEVGPDIDENLLADGVLLPPNVQYFVEVGDRGEGVSRFGCSAQGEVGDAEGAASPNVTWTVNPNCNGGGCITQGGIEGGDYAKHSEFFGGNRDFVMITHLVLGDVTPPSKLPFCPTDIVGPGGTGPDLFTNINDLLAILSSWGTLAPPRPLGDVGPGERGDNLVNITDLLRVLAEWGECDNPNKLCADLLAAANDPGNTSPGLIVDSTPVGYKLDSAFHDGPLRGETDDVNEVIRSGGNGCGWGSFGPGGTANGFQWGDVFSADGGYATAPLGNVGNGDVWFHYTAECSGRATFETSGDGKPTANSDTIMEVYPGALCPTDAGDLLVCNDDGSGIGGFSRAQVNVLAGETYLIRVGTWDGSQPDTTGIFTAICEDNSSCDSALPLAMDSSTTGNTTGASNNQADTCLGVSQSFGGRWFTIVGTGETITVSTAGSCALDDLDNSDGVQSAFDSAISVYCGTEGTVCADLGCVASAEGINVCNLHEELTFCSNDGDTYYVLVHGGAENLPSIFGEGVFDLAVSSDGLDCSGADVCGIPRPANDDCEDATVLPSGSDDDEDLIITVVANVSNLGAIDDGNVAGNGCGALGDDVWHLWTAPATGTVTLSTCNAANYDVKMEAYDASLATCPATDNTGLFVCDDDTTGCAGFTYDTVVAPGPFTIFAGQTVLFRSGSSNFGIQESGAGNNMTITLNIAESECPLDCTGIDIEGNNLGETLLDDGDEDVTNGGCNMCVPAWDSITESSQVCGQISTFQTNADLDCDTFGDGTLLDMRDTDWYEIVVPDTADGFGSTRGSRLNIALSAEFSSSYGVVGDTCAGGPDVETPFIASAITGGLCIAQNLTVDLEAGTYFIVVTAFNTSGVEVGGDGVTHEGHDYLLDVGAFEPAQLPPVNDECADAIDLNANDLVVIDQRYATNAASDPALSCNGNNGLANGSAWYTFTATHASTEINTCGSTIGGDSNFGVFEPGNELAPCATLTSIFCSEDECNPGGFLSTTRSEPQDGSDVNLLTTLTPGSVYYIQLGAWSAGDQSIYDLEIISPAP